jgi:glyoxylase-like metal-dependent hydrolase (beta-lactamase superfamily II)
MKNHVLTVGMYEANCVVLWEDPAQAWVIDPGADSRRIFAYMEKEGLKPGVVVLTHAHFDHIAALGEVLAKFPGIPVYLHREDEAMAFSPLNQMTPYSATERPETLDTGKRDGDTIECGGLTAKVIHTPGHTPGSWCLHFEADKLLVTGDTLFNGSIGRTDFPGGSMREIEASLLRLRELPDDTHLICGHGHESTLGSEKKYNPFLKENGL